MPGILNKIQGKSFDIKNYERMTKNFQSDKLVTVMGFGFPEFYIMSKFNLIEIEFSDELEKYEFTNTKGKELNKNRIQEIETPEVLYYNIDGNINIQPLSGINYKQYNLRERIINEIYDNYTNLRKEFHSILAVAVEEYEKLHISNLDPRIVESIIKQIYELNIKHDNRLPRDFQMSNLASFKDLLERKRNVKISVDLVPMIDSPKTFNGLIEEMRERINDLEFGHTLLKNRIRNLEKPDIFKEIPEDLLEDDNMKRITGDDAVKVKERYMMKKSKELGKYNYKLLELASILIAKYMKELEDIRVYDYLNRFRGTYNDLSEFEEYFKIFSEHSKVKETLEFNVYSYTKEISSQSSTIKHYQKLLFEITKALKIERNKYKYLKFLEKETPEPVKNFELIFKYLY